MSAEDYEGMRDRNMNEKRTTGGRGHEGEHGVQKWGAGQRLAGGLPHSSTQSGTGRL